MVVASGGGDVCLDGLDDAPRRGGDRPEARRGDRCGASSSSTRSRERRSRKEDGGGGGGNIMALGRLLSALEGGDWSVRVIAPCAPPSPSLSLSSCLWGGYLGADRGGTGAVKARAGLPPRSHEPRTRARAERKRELREKDSAFRFVHVVG